MAFLSSSSIDARRVEYEDPAPRPTRALDKTASLARLRVCIGRVLVGLLAVPIRGFGVLPGRFELADLVVVSRLDMVMRGGGVVDGGPVVVLGCRALPGRRRCGALGGRGHDSILL
jgi:hypothetical protein